MGLRRRWRRRRRERGHRLTVAEANLRAQCAALGHQAEEPEHDPAAPALIDVAALERERLFARHPRAGQPPSATD